MDFTQRQNQIEKVKANMMQVMGITDPAEFQRIAKDYCKDMASELCLPLFHRLFSRISKVIEKSRDKFDKLDRVEKLKEVMKAAMEDVETIDTFKLAFEEEDAGAEGLKADVSGGKRAEGNAAFQKKKDKDALKLYTEAMFSAKSYTEEGKRDIALALANRSAVLIKLEKYEKCLEDIEAAIHFGYPENIRFKLLDRQAKCLTKLGRFSEAVQSYNRLVLALKQANLDQDKIEKWKKDTMNEIEQLKNKPDSPVAKPEPTIPTLQINNPNKKIPQFSDCIDLVYKEKLGRYGVATRDIEAGELLMIDTSVTHHLISRTRETHCTHCMKRVKEDEGIPSPLCFGTRFCCMLCLKTAMDTYHPVEAKINLEKFFWSRRDKKYEDLSGNIPLTYRAITQKPLSYFMDTWKDNFDNVDPKFGAEFADENDLCKFNDYRNIFNLEGHRNERKNDEMLSLGIRTVLLIVFLRHGGYFGDKETPYAAVLSEAELTMGRIAFHIQEGIQFNLHSVDEVLSTKLSGIATPELNEVTKFFHGKKVGAALFPTLLLLNHSCEPNTLRLCANGNQSIMVAKRKIKKGAEVSDNYGVHHVSIPFEERQERLSRGFHFACCCDACSYDYPRLKSLKDALPEKVEEEYDALRENVKDNFRRKDSEACLKDSIEMIKLLEKNKIRYPHRYYELAALSLLSCLWTMYGNHH